MNSKFEEWLDGVSPNYALTYKRIGILYLLDAWKAGTSAMFDGLAEKGFIKGYPPLVKEEMMKEFMENSE